MRYALLTAALAALLAHPARAADDNGLGAPASQVTPPVELTISLRDGKPVCAPSDLRLPADTDVTLNVVSHADTPVTVTIPGQFEGGRLLKSQGDLVHVSSEKGYLVKANGRGMLKLRTLAAGDHTYACTATDKQDAPFTGKFVTVPPAN